MILVSACLAGVKCNFRGRSRTNQKILELVKKGVALPVCPEVLGGLPTPRSGARILSKDKDFDGNDVLDSKTIIINEEGKDVTENYIKGAYKALETAKKYNIKEAYLNQYSPSCGHGKTLGGNRYYKKYVSGDGVTTALFKRNNIKVLTDEEFEEFYNREKNVLTKYFKVLGEFR
jgi:uncharacterized protein YbbK (DUF523 family)